MSAKLPYMTSSGLVTRILNKIQEARKPDRFTQDFLDTKLGFSGGSAKAIIPLLKRMDLLNSDGTPTPLYDRFRNITTQDAAIAEGMRKAYSELFDRNRYAGDLAKDKLKALIVEVTGAAHDDRTVEATLSTFFKLREFADFGISSLLNTHEYYSLIECHSDWRVSQNKGQIISSPVSSLDRNKFGKFLNQF